MRKGSRQTDRREPSGHPANPELRDNDSRPKTLTSFLLRSGIWPLEFAGKCGQFFGWGSVLGFVAGAAVVWGYANFRPLPFLKPPPAPVEKGGDQQQPAQPRMVQLHGLVRDASDQPAKWFNVGIFATQQGPLTNSDGSFNMLVPESSAYDVAFWIDDQTTGFFKGAVAERDGNGYRLQTILQFSPKPPSAVARTAINGSVKNQVASSR